MTTQDYIAKAPIIPEYILTAHELFTVIISIVGIGISLYLSNFFRKDKSALSVKLYHEYITDFLACVVMLIMGLSLYFNMPLAVKMAVLIRPYVLLLNVVAMVRLYKHFVKRK